MVVIPCVTVTPTSWSSTLSNTVKMTPINGRAPRRDGAPVLSVHGGDEFHFLGKKFVRMGSSGDEIKEGWPVEGPPPGPTPF
jgi:hypothetical protein